jgi:hypothetical protein
VDAVHKDAIDDKGAGEEGAGDDGVREVTEVADEGDESQFRDDPEEALMELLQSHPVEGRNQKHFHHLFQRTD